MKLTKHAWTLWTILLLVVASLALLIPFVHTTVYWIALSCTGVMFILCALTFERAFRKDQTLESKLLGYPVFKVGAAATIVQTIIGFVLMALATLCPLRVAILTEILVFAGTAFCLTTKDAARETVMQFETNVSDNTSAWKKIRSRADALAAEMDNPEMRKLAEAIRFADPAPCSLDEKISATLETLTSATETETIRQLFALLQQRQLLVKREK